MNWNPVWTRQMIVIEATGYIDMRCYGNDNIACLLHTGSNQCVTAITVTGNN